jgi:hypothetical protein
MGVLTHVIDVTSVTSSPPKILASVANFLRFVADDAKSKVLVFPSQPESPPGNLPNFNRRLRYFQLASSTGFRELIGIRYIS